MFFQKKNREINGARLNQIPITFERLHSIPSPLITNAFNLNRHTKDWWTTICEHCVNKKKK